MHAQRTATLSVDEDVDGVVGIGMHGRHDPAGLVGADGNEAEVEGAAVLADLCEGRAVRQVCVLGAVVIFAGGHAGDGAVACVAGGLLEVGEGSESAEDLPGEVDFYAAGIYHPACPEGFAFVEWCSGADVLAGERADGRCDGFLGGLLVVR